MPMSQRAGSEQDLSTSVTSEVTEESAHSATEHSDGSHEPDYVNKRGVRFTPDQMGKEGGYTALYTFMVVVACN